MGLSDFLFLLVWAIFVVPRYATYPLTGFYVLLSSEIWIYKHSLCNLKNQQSCLLDFFIYSFMLLKKFSGVVSSTEHYKTSLSAFWESLDIIR